MTKNAINSETSLRSLGTKQCAKRAASFVIKETAGSERRGEPVTLGVPLPAGDWSIGQAWVIRDEAGRDIPCQTKTTATWPDGSIRWLSVSLLADAAANSITELQLVAVEDDDSTASSQSIVADRSADDLVLQAGPTHCLFAASGNMLMRELNHDGRPVLAKRSMRLIATGADGRASEGIVEEVNLVELGSVRAVAKFRGHFPRQRELRFFGHFTLYGDGLLRLEITLHNPRRARHASGYWELGDPGSIMLREVALSLHLGRGLGDLECREDPTDEPQKTNGGWSLYQESSGGEQWQSTNHVDRDGEVPMQQRGYRIVAGELQRQGLRASPTVVLRGEHSSLALGWPDFWEKFPSAMVREGDKLRLGILPREYPTDHELQAGEQTTRVFWLHAAGEPDAPDLRWCHDPLVASCDAETIHRSEAIPFLPSPQDRPRPEFQAAMQTALEGAESFFAKRERIDEYGWRNFGELWADHEGAYHNPEGRELISHFNNQYDPLHGMLIQYLLTSDERWWRLADSLAKHVMDIDIYHTDRDKPAYNGGLFWHTDHYFDAARATHRTMSHEMKDGERACHGGGPGNEQSYNAGLALYYYLTDDPRARELALGLADWVIAMDDGTRNLRSIASSQPTGLSSATAMSDYHGPGRGSGNSINVLLDAWLLSGSEQYRELAELLIRRTVHPHDDVLARDLRNFELRWSYTVHLQALARYLELARRFQVDAAMVAYVRESLLHYARWMAEHEVLTLDHTDQLDYPTETWAVQDMRKANVLGQAARHAGDEEAELFRAAAERLMEGAWRQLMQFPSRTFTRPVALLLQQGYIETYLAGEGGKAKVTDLAPATSAGFDPPEPFIFQKQDIKRNLKRPVGWLCIAGCVLRPARWRNVWGQSWTAELLRRKH